MILEREDEWISTLAVHSDTGFLFLIDPNRIIACILDNKYRRMSRYACKLTINQSKIALPVIYNVTRKTTRIQQIELSANVFSH